MQGKLGSSPATLKTVRFRCGCDETFLSTSSAYERAKAAAPTSNCSLCEGEHQPQFSGNQARVPLGIHNGCYRHVPVPMA